MSRSPIFTDVIRALRLAHFCTDHRLSTADGLTRVREAEIERASLRRGRREWMKTVARTSALGAAACVTAPVRRVLAGSKQASLDVGIVGAGLAGLACADALADRGVVATVYDANTRPGGRCLSLRGLFPGQAAERGGEFIDHLHKTMLQYAQRFDLAVEDVSKVPGEVTYHFGGQHVPEAAVVDEFRDFVQVMHLDLRRLSREVTALSHTNADVAIDRTSLLAYLDGANAAGNRVFPGAQVAARPTPGGVVAHLEHWPSNPLTRGSYTSYRPGQFTTIAGLEGLPAGNLFFAGEHANSFYDIQGFMEGAALSGIDAAAAILRN